MKIKYLSLVLALITACNSQSTLNEEERNTGAENSRTSLDWAGDYKGVLPCEACEGIFTQLSLKSDNSYTLTKRYIGRTDSLFTAEGTAAWMSDNNRIAIGNMAFRVGEGRLMLLPSKESTAPASELPNSLVKVTSDDITDTYWRLTHVGSIDVATMTMGSQRFSEPHIILHSYNNRMSGSNSCNRIMGGFELGEGNSLKFKQIASTMMACEGNMLENFFNSALNKIVRYETDGKTLTLFSEIIEELKFERGKEEKM